MPLVQAKCSSCGAALQVDQSKDTSICEYCGAAFIVEKATGKQSGNNYDFLIEKGILLEYKGSDSHVTIPDNVIVIGPKAFDRVYCLKSVVIPEHVQEVVDTAFHNCEMLTDITVNGDTGFSSTAFYGCRKLTNITLHGNIEVGVRNLNASVNAFKPMYKLPEQLETDNSNVANSIFNFLYGNTPRNRPIFVNGVNVLEKLSLLLENTGNQINTGNRILINERMIRIIWIAALIALVVLIVVAFVQCRADPVDSQISGIWEHWGLYVPDGFPDVLWLRRDGSGEYDGKTLKWERDGNRLIFYVSSDGKYTYTYRYAEGTFYMLYLTNELGITAEYYGSVNSSNLSD